MAWLSLLSAHVLENDVRNARIYLFTEGGDDIYVNLFIGSETELSLSDQSRIRLTQKTGYPWDGSVVMTVEPEKEKTFLLKVRIPGWAQGVENP